MRSIRSLVIIGSGNVASHMAKAFKAAGLDIYGIYSRTFDSAKNLADELNVTTYKRIIDIPINADAYFFAVSDSALPEILKALPCFEGILMHSSGSVGLGIFAEKFKKTAVFYPLQTFSKAKKVDLSRVPILIEASDKEVLKSLQDLGYRISNTVKRADSLERKQLHLSAVFACNFSNYMFHIAQDLLSKDGLDFNLLKPLISETIEKLNSLSPAEAQTGPAIRDDIKTLNEHLEMLKYYPEYQSIYKLISDQIRKLKS